MVTKSTTTTTWDIRDLARTRVISKEKQITRTLLQQCGEENNHDEEEEEYEKEEAGSEIM